MGIVNMEELYRELAPFQGLSPIPDWAIAKLSKGNFGMIQPFVADQVQEHEGEKVVSYGVGPCGYDIRLGTHFKRLRGSGISDPKNFTVMLEEFWDADRVILSAGSYMLGVSNEHFTIPDTVFALVIGKSTYARCGLLINATPLEPGWEGYITLELSNLSPSPLAIYPGEGIAQVIFFLLPRRMAPRQSYDGRYQNAPSSPQAPQVREVKDG